MSKILVLFRPFLVLLLVAGCAGAEETRRPRTLAPADDPPATQGATSESPPLGRLPRDVRPEKYTLALTVDPTQDKFTGSARIDVVLDRSRELIYLHGNGLEVAEATVTPEGGEPIPATWKQLDEHGVASLTLERQVGPGKATLGLTYAAPFDRKLKGLYRVDEGGESYAFTQFEATDARKAFPSFDEPSFKTPFDVTLVVKKDHVAAMNTPVASTEELEGGLKRVHFETTKPEPTYLVAMAVGPLDVVEVDPIPQNGSRNRELPLRALAVKGKGQKLAYALEHTPAIVASLERYFGAEYPYRKLDIVAVPDFAAGAMENVGLVTFRETLLLLDDDPPEWQKRGFAGVMAHELSHMWFGDLVTMPWWDDIWLNEAFATWMGHKTVDDVFPEHQASLSMLSSVERAMRSDSLTSARQIRQPIESNHDIRNAFDSITYSKGGGVLAMFERYLGKEVFQKGIRAYMQKHAFGNATADDLLTALSEASGKDVATPFRTFLFQPGLPFVHVDVTCEGDAAALELSQSRYFPVGSPGKAEATWQIPFCYRYATGEKVEERCTLVTEAKAKLALEGETCPRWVMPNADASGYYRFALSPEDLDKLKGEAWDALAAREKVAVADAVRASFETAAMKAKEVFGAFEPMAESEIRAVAGTPMSLLRFTRSYVVDEGDKADLDRFAGKLYQKPWKKLGWKAGPKDDGETKLLRASMASFLAMTVEDPKARRTAGRLGRRYLGKNGKLNEKAVDTDLADTVLAVTLQDGDAALFDRVLDLFLASTDAVMRGRLLGALSSVRDPERAARARALALDERVRVNEALTPVWAQINMPETRQDTWTWLKENYDKLTARLSKGHAGYLPWLASDFCSEEKAKEVEAFFRPHIGDLPGGPRNLAGALEAVRLCAARVKAHRESTAQFFE